MSQPLSYEEARELAAKHGLVRVDSVTSFSAYLAECWRMRYFTYQYAVGRVISLSTKNRLGLLWEFFTPLLTALMYYVAFGLILGTHKDSENFIFFLIAGVLTWQLFVQAFSLSSQSLVQGRDLSSSMRFPQVLIPLSAGIQALVRTLPTLLLLYPTALLTGVPVTWSWLLLPFQMVLVVLVGLGIGLMLAKVMLRVRDLQEAVPIAIRALMFTSGIFYSVEIRFADAPNAIRWFAENQPVAVLLNLTRGIFIPADMPGPYKLTGIVIAALVLMMLGLVIFWRGERRHG